MQLLDRAVVRHLCENLPNGCAAGFGVVAIDHSGYCSSSGFTILICWQRSYPTIAAGL